MMKKVDFRVGRITSVRRHPEAEKLYVEEIDLGEEEEDKTNKNEKKKKIRTIVSGLADHFTTDQLQNRFVVVAANLKPMKLRGVESQGMVLAASDPKKVELLAPPSSAKVGDRVVVIEGGDGAVFEPVLNPKQKIWESISVDLKTDDNCVATWRGKQWLTKITVDSLKNCIIK